MDQPDQALEEARRAGIDLDLLDSNLALTYEQRALRHESARELVLALREAGATYAGSAIASGNSFSRPTAPQRSQKPAIESTTPVTSTRLASRLKCFSSQVGG